MRPGRGAAAFASLLASLLAACDTSTTDPLDVDLLAELAKSVGDASGGARTGTWTITAEERECSCDDELGTALCIPSQLAGIALAIDVVEGGGFLLMRGPLTGPTSGISYEPSGAVNADGTFDLGYVEVALSLAAEVITVARMDGEFAADDLSFTATLRARASGTLGEIDWSCQTVLDVEGERGF